MADSSSNLFKALTTSMTFVEKATEFRHFMLLTAFLLALDSCLVIFYKVGLLEAFSSVSLTSLNLSGPLIFLGIFSFLMAVFFPALRYVLKIPIELMAERWPATAKTEVGHETKNPDVARKEAILNNDKLKLELVEKFEESRSHFQTTLNIGFSVAALAFINYWVIDIPGIKTLSQEVAAMVDFECGFWLKRIIHAVLGTLMIVILGMLALSLHPGIEDKVYIPEKKSEPEAEKPKSLI